MVGPNDVSAFLVDVAAEIDGGFRGCLNPVDPPLDLRPRFLSGDPDAGLYFSF